MQIYPIAILMVPQNALCFILVILLVAACSLFSICSWDEVYGQIWEWFNSRFCVFCVPFCWRMEIMSTISARSTFHFQWIISWPRRRTNEQMNEWYWITPFILRRVACSYIAQSSLVLSLLSTTSVYHPFLIPTVYYTYTYYWQNDLKFWSYL